MAEHSGTVQGELWSVAAGDWACLMEHVQRPGFDRGIRVAGVGSGTRFLDAGCGSGGACVLASNAGARVTGLDAAPAMIAIARDRLPTATFHIGELQALPFPDVSFDVVFSANALQYATSPLEALREQVRVLDHAGRLVIVLWGRHDDCDMERAVFPAVRKLLPPPAPGTPQPLGLSDPPVLDALVREVGLNTLTSEFVDTPYEFADLDLAWRALRPAGPIERAIRAVGADVVKAAVNEAMRPFVAVGGIVRLHNTFRVVVASRA